MNYSGQDQVSGVAKLVADMNARSGVIGLNPALAPNPPNETIGSITQDSLREMGELCSLLSTVADGLSGPIPQVEGQREKRDNTLHNQTLELREAVRRAMSLTYRIAGAL